MPGAFLTSLTDFIKLRIQVKTEETNLLGAEQALDDAKTALKQVTVGSDAPVTGPQQTP